MVSNNIFIVTGMARSGTTLAEKLLCNHKDISILSQPFPKLFYHLKKQFFHVIGHPEKYYFLNDLFNEKKYSNNDLISFLDSYHLNKDELEGIFNDMSEWSGQLTRLKDFSSLFSDYSNKNLIETYKYLLNKYGHDHGAGMLGSKEIMIEEFAPYFIENNVRVIIIVRDPRDVITSINYGKGPEYAGKHRPILFHLRNWRKSIAILLSLINHPKFLFVKYEKLVHDTYLELKKITDFLGVAQFENGRFDQGIKDQNGKPWRSNTSTSSGGSDFIQPVNEKFMKYLDPEVISYIEYMCWPEMKFLGYEPKFISSPFTYTPSAFAEPFNIETKNLPPGMSIEENNLKLEKKRLELLYGRTEGSLEELLGYYFSSQGYNMLRKAIIS
jgi:hypothetical protein